MARPNYIIDGIEYTPEEVVRAANGAPYTWILQNNIKNEVVLVKKIQKEIHMVF